jgi:hypothetical protein
MSEQPTPAPGIDIPPSYVIDGLRQELATVRDENSILQIKINFLNETVAVLQHALDAAATEHTHDHAPESDADDTPVE